MMKKLAVTLLLTLLVVLAGLGLLYSLFAQGKGSPTTNMPTITHGLEVRSVIKVFEETVGSFEVQSNRKLLSSVMTDELLESWLSFGPATTYSILTRLELTKVRVFEYTPSQFVALGCGYKTLDTIIRTGKLISHQRFFLQVLYVFRQEEGTWKLVLINGSPDGRWYWSSAWEIQALDAYVRQNEACGRH
jgi:hypothetical protein